MATKEEPTKAEQKAKADMIAWRAKMRKEQQAIKARKALERRQAGK